MKKVISKVMAVGLLATMIGAPMCKNVYAETQPIIDSADKVESTSISKSIFKVADYYSALEKVDEWQIPAMVRTKKLTEGQKEIQLGIIKERIENGYEYSSQMAKDILALSALGENPQEFCNHDLVNEMIEKGDYIGLANFEAWVIVAATKGDYKIEENNRVLLENIYEDILACQDKSGGFSYYQGGDWIDVDMTGIALYAISSYEKDDERTIEAKDRAINYINVNKDKEGKFNNSNTTSMAILGLSSVGEDISILVEDLLTYQVEDGQFKWIHEEDGGNYLATEQAFYALVQSEAIKNGVDLFDFRYEWYMEDESNIIAPPEEEKPIEEEKPSEEDKTSEENQSENENNFENKTTTDDSKTSTASSTKTGDKNNIGLLSGIFTMSIFTLGYFALKNKERKNG